MKDSIPYLRRLVAELQAENKSLRDRGPEVVEVVKEVIKEVPVDRIVEKHIVTQLPPVTITEYIDNPEHIRTIRSLQEQLCQYTSQSDS